MNTRSRNTRHFVTMMVVGMILSIGLCVTPAVPTQAQIAIYVDDNTCPATGAGTTGNPYCRIQDAVNAAQNGYEIRVAAGAYTGTQTVAIKQWEGLFNYTQVVAITKSITLQGGYSPANWYIPDPTANITIIDAEQQGRGISIIGTYNIHPQVTIDGFTITGGDYTGLGNPAGIGNQVCASASVDCGGGLFVYESGLILRNSIITGNIASRNSGEGGGIYIWKNTGSTQIDNTLVTDNAAKGNDGTGGGLYAVRIHQPFTITHSTFQNNNADNRGGGMSLSYNIEALVTISETDFLDNTSHAEGGGVYIRLSNNGELLNMDRVRFQNNQADSRAGAILIDAAGPVTPKARLTNLLLTENRLISASARDALIGIDGEFTSLEVELAHITAANNSAVTFLYAESANYPGKTVTVKLTNTLLSFFTNAYAVEEYGSTEVTIHHTNTLHQYVTNLHQNVGGSPTFTAVNPLSGDPKLNSTYHLSVGSAAIDAGVDAGVKVDIDGEPRPFGNGYDIGADELTLYKILLPLVLR